MSDVPAGAVGLGAAVASHLRHAARRALLVAPRGGPPRDRAFHAYAREVRRRTASAPTSLRVVGRRVVAEDAVGSIVEIALRGPSDARTGDMLYAWWSNSADAVRGCHAGPAADVAYWSTPVPGRPARRRRASAEHVLTSVVDLAGTRADDDAVHGGAAGLLAVRPRIEPRLYTVAGVRDLEDGEREVRLLVTRRAHWPARSAAHLTGLGTGDVVRAWALPHPHRTPVLRGATGPGLAVATGSGLAGVLATLREHALLGPCAEPAVGRLVWGSRAAPAQWLLDELRGYVDTGVLGRLDVVGGRGADRRRVTDVLGTCADEVRACVTDGWVYVSGHREMAASVDALVRRVAGDAAVDAGAARLHYVESA
ncbi:hypothetical protein SAMN04489860_0177 [Paraoerskovia marina]|uniref:NADPH-dependent ferric siderophore reductase, contains FAD-binding and SIP domains n=1 Tax=Paraoerskovia marina TaxID=545619 RepID=A0A1H1M9Y1_9CELL|nr:hypothetical protein [Paraoerskovia marina]SDR83480.1 hypothetical protein SAMN04489860_0177 [Paraoerskovia marina]